MSGGIRQFVWTNNKPAGKYPFYLLFNVIILAKKYKKIASKVDSIIKKLQGEIYTYTYVYGKR